MKKLILVFLTTLLLSACQSERNKEITIGHIAPLTGNAAIWGKWEAEGIDLAVKNINQNGGIRNNLLKIIREDDKADPKIAISAFLKLVDFDKVHAIIGATLSSTTLAISPIANRKEIVIMSPSAQSPKISLAGEYVFRIFASSTIEGRYLSKLPNKYNTDSIAIFYLNNDYGVGLNNVIIDNLKKNNNITILKDVAYKSDDKNLHAQVNSVISAKPNGIYILGYYDGIGQILKILKERNYSAKIFAPNGFEGEEIFEIAGKAAEGVIYIYPIIPNKDKKQFIMDAFYQLYGHEMNIYNAMGYDALMLYAKAIETIMDNNLEVTGENIKKELLNFKEYNGITGIITFDKNGDVMDRPMELRIVENQSFVTLESF